MRVARWALAAWAATSTAAAAEPLAPDAEAAAAAACPALPALPAFSHQLAGPPLGCTEAERAEWLAHMKACRSAALRNISYHGGVFDTPPMQWTQDAFAVPMVASFDREIYDDSREYGPGEYGWTVDRFVAGLKARYGGADAVLLWPTYENIGLDDRSQVSLYQALPGGFEGMTNLTDQLHAVSAHAASPGSRTFFVAALSDLPPCRGRGAAWGQGALGVQPMGHGDLAVARPQHRRAGARHRAHELCPAAQAHPRRWHQRRYDEVRAEGLVGRLDQDRLAARVSAATIDR